MMASPSLTQFLAFLSMTVPSDFKATKVGIPSTLNFFLNFFPILDSCAFLTVMPTSCVP